MKKIWVIAPSLEVYETWGEFNDVFIGVDIYTNVNVSTNRNIIEKMFTTASGRNIALSKCFFSRREAEYACMHLLIKKNRKLRAERFNNKLKINQMRDYLLMGVDY